MCTLAADILNNSTIAALQCSQPGSSCLALCANPDLSGVGVRAAFYAQSVLNTFMVILSPRDSVASAWAGTLLTTSLIIAAIVQKISQELTLHHATLIMNFATLSCISSLSVAPLLPIWHPGGLYCDRDFNSSPSLDGNDPPTDRMEIPFVDSDRGRLKRDAQNRERIVMSLALLSQVILQWAWGIILFVSPIYSQKECNAETVVVFFLRRFTVQGIETTTGFAVWPLWLLFSLGITLGLTISLALSRASRAHILLSRRSTMSSIGMVISRPSEPIITQIFAELKRSLHPFRRSSEQLGAWGYITSFVLWLVYIISSEMQIRSNCIFSGENTFSGFGQITAVLLSLAPLWSLTVALYRYPSLHRKRQRYQIRQNTLSSERQTSVRRSNRAPVGMVQA